MLEAMSLSESPAVAGLTPDERAYIRSPLPVPDVLESQ
jgi:hypothetical protein